MNKPPQVEITYPHRLVSPVAEHLVGILRPACLRIELGGSLRRLRPRAGDIEIVAIPKTEPLMSRELLDVPGESKIHNFLWAALDGLGDLVDWIHKGNKARAFWYPLPEDEGKIKVDLFTATRENWGLIHLIRTGSAKFSREIVTRLARARRPSHDGYVRDATGVLPEKIEFGIPKWSDSKKDAMPTIPTPEEEDVFRLALMGPLPPADRNWE